MKKYKNGVPMLSSAAISVAKSFIENALRFNAGFTGLSIYKRNKNKGKKAFVLSVSFVGKDIYLTYKGYRYRYVDNVVFLPLNTRDGHIIRFYKRLASYQKKGYHNIGRRIKL